MTLKNLNLKTIGLSIAVIASLASTNNSMAMESNCSSEHPKTILPGGLREIEPGCLFVGENITPNDTPIYDAYEKIGLTNNYKYNSMQLHGFSAAVQLSFFEGREFMETTPIDSMKNIMINKGVPIEGANVKVDLKALAKFYSKDLT